MEIETILRESQAEQYRDRLGIQTEVGKQQFAKQLRFWTSNQEAILRRQSAILSLRKELTPPRQDTLNEVFQTIATLEPELGVFFEKSDVEKNSYEQLTFSSWVWAQVFNTIPFALLVLSYFKLYVVPALALFTPVLLLILPYFILIYGYNLPISFDQYKDLMMGMMGIQSQTLWTPKGLLQTGLTLFSVVQGMVQPVQNAIHLKTVDANLVKKGQAVETLAKQLCLLQTYIPFKNPLEDIATQADPHRSFGDAWDLPFRLKLALQFAGDAEVTYRLAASPLTAVQFRSTGGFLLKHATDPLLPTGVPFTVELSSKSTHHAILTGPNRGGKSSFLRGTLLNLVFAQTFGLASCDTCILRPLDWIASGLKLEDRPGKSSMFEREVEFAVEILKRSRESPQEVGLVLFDELFHSTNPPDGTRTAKLFLDQVWKQSNLISIISTHVFDIAHKAPVQVQQLCVPAEKTDEGNLRFTYTLQQGVCEVSSVDLILKEKGLLRGN